jgi:hypothetical protein
VLNNEFERTRWLKKDRRTDRDLLEDLDRPEVVTESHRTALTPEQAPKLIWRAALASLRRKWKPCARS